MQHSLGSIKRKGFCEIAVSPFDPAHLVHTGGDDRRAPNHDELILGALPPTLGSNAEWIGQTASVRLSSGCAVIVAPEAGVPLMHMLQVCLNDISCSMYVLLISHHPSPLPCAGGAEGARLARCYYLPARQCAVPAGSTPYSSHRAGSAERAARAHPRGTSRRGVRDLP